MNKEDLMNLKDEVYNLYRKMDIEEKIFIFPGISGFLEHHIEQGQKTVEIEALYKIVKRFIEEISKYDNENGESKKIVMIDEAHSIFSLSE